MSNISVSVVIPVYGCCDCLFPLYERLKSTLLTITEEFEIILVNDDSPDNSWSVITDLCGKDNRVKGINLSRNFGQHYAITAGMDHVQGDWVVVMDCDLQDKPEELVKLYNKALEGYDIVFGRRHLRQDKFFKRLSSKFFYKIYDYFTDGYTDAAIANYSVVSKNVVNSYRRLKEQNRDYSLVINWLGFKKASVDIEHQSRGIGKSSYTLKKLLTLAADSIVSQSNKPLRLSIIFGFLMALGSLCYAALLTVRYILYSIPVEGWTSVMVSMYLLTGMLFVNLGFLGLYIGKIFNETKARPLYLIRESINLEDK